MNMILMQQRSQIFQGVRKVQIHKQLDKLQARCATVVTNQSTLTVRIDQEVEINNQSHFMEKLVAAGAQRNSLNFSRNTVMSILAGVYIGFGAFLSMSCGGSSFQLQAIHPGVAKLFSGAVGVPFGLFMCLVCGAELLTGSLALESAAVFAGKMKLTKAVKNLCWTCVGNIVGAGLLVGIVTSCGLPPIADGFIKVAQEKVQATFMEGFVRGILCNWLVGCVQVLATNSTTVLGHFLAALLPTTIYQGVGLEQSVADMFVVPLGMCLGANISMATYVQFLVPVLIGNVVGGVVFGAMALDIGGKIKGEKGGVVGGNKGNGQSSKDGNGVSGKAEKEE